MTQDFPDFIERVLLREDALRRPLPPEPLDIEMVLRIREASDDQLLGGAQLRSPELLPLLRGGLFYYHDALDEARRHAEPVGGALGDYWRQMIARRAGEFDLARECGRRAGELPPFQLMMRLVADESPHMGRQSNWDAYLLNRLGEQYRFGDTDLEAELRKLQRVEFDQIYRYTWHRALGE